MHMLSMITRAQCHASILQVQSMPSIFSQFYVCGKLKIVAYKCPRLRQDQKVWFLRSR